MVTKTLQKRREHKPHAKPIIKPRWTTLDNELRSLFDSAGFQLFSIEYPCRLDRKRSAITVHFAKARSDEFEVACEESASLRQLHAGPSLRELPARTLMDMASSGGDSRLANRQQREDPFRGLAAAVIQQTYDDLAADGDRLAIAEWIADPSSNFRTWCELLGVKSEFVARRALALIQSPTPASGRFNYVDSGIRCWRCERKLAEKAERPWRFVCHRCKAINHSAA